MAAREIRTDSHFLQRRTLKLRVQKGDDGTLACQPNNIDDVELPAQICQTNRIDELVKGRARATEELGKCNALRARGVVEDFGNLAKG